MMSTTREHKRTKRKHTKTICFFTRFYTNTNNYTNNWNLHYYTTTGDLRKTKSQKHKKTRWERWTHRQNQSKGWIALNGLSLLRERANQRNEHSHVESVREYSQKIQHDERTACIRSHRRLNEGQVPKLKDKQLRDDLSPLCENHQRKHEASLSNLSFTLSIISWKQQSKHTSNWLALSWRAERFYSLQQACKRCLISYQIKQKTLWLSIEFDSIVSKSKSFILTLRIQ